MEIAVGIVLGLFVALSGLGALALGWSALREARFLHTFVALLLLLIFVWGAQMVWRLITGRSSVGGGLMSPTALGFTGIFFIFLPLAAALGTEWHLRDLSGWLKLAQALLYIAVGGSLLVLRAQRLRG